MKFLASLCIGIYVLGSLPCEAGAKASCCHKSEESPKTCHSSSHASTADQKGAEGLSPCCCSISSNIPKGVENFRGTFVTVFLPFGSGVSVMSEQKLAKIRLDLSLGPPGNILASEFYKAVFPSQAPPLKTVVSGKSQGVSF